MSADLAYIPLTKESTVYDSAAICMPDAREPEEALASLRRAVHEKKMGRHEITRLAKDAGISSRIIISLLVEAVTPLKKEESWKKSEEAIIDL